MYQIYAQNLIVMKLWHLLAAFAGLITFFLIMRFISKRKKKAFLASDVIHDINALKETIDEIFSFLHNRDTKEEMAKDDDLIHPTLYSDLDALIRKIADKENIEISEDDKKTIDIEKNNFEDVILGLQKMLNNVNLYKQCENSKQGRVIIKHIVNEYKFIKNMS